MIEPLRSTGCTLSRAGGKGANLSILIRNGFPVPDGFVLTTDAYRAFVSAAGLGDWLLTQAESVTASDPAALDAVSGAIRERFAAAAIPVDVRDAIVASYAQLDRHAVAVRSSATTEDLPDLSFAGQQETFLNVIGEPALLEAVVRCWSSLWTPRAIGYRSRNAIGHRDLALAVVVQQMVDSDSSGVLFTANPVTGKRTETLVEATLGLGEALVSGRVEPDRYTVAVLERRITSRALGSKRLSIRVDVAGGIAERHEDAAAMPALDDDTIIRLAELGDRAAQLLHAPQDIEWAVARRQLWLLQSRPITSLYPLPDGMTPEPLQVLVSIGAVQGMLDPFTPLGQDVLRVALRRAILGRLGIQIEPNDRGPVVVAGDRLFMNITPALRNRFGRGRIRAGLPLIEPGTHALLENLLSDSRLSPARGRIPYAALLPLARIGVRMLTNISLNLIRPSARRVKIVRRIETAVAALEARKRSVRTPADSVALLDDAFSEAPRVLIPFAGSGIATGIGMLQLLHRLADGVPGGEQLVLESTRGLPHNVTTEMDLALWRAAQDGSRSGLDAFLEKYGMRGVGEIDIGRPRWREDPTQLVQVMASYRRLPPQDAPDAVFARGAASAMSALERLEEQLRHRPGGWWRARLARWAGGRMRALAGLRELPKFFLIRVMGVIRESLLATCGPDVFFLHLAELRALAAGDTRDVTASIAERRARYERERRRRRVPRILLSDGQAFHGDEQTTADAGEGVLVGSGVSPGMVEGVARIVFNPHAAQLAPGEILVCPGTDPAWTPLFLAAGGLVTEVGGVLTHGSVVAREYGIPAVVGVHGATTRLVDGQRVRVDGSAGRVTMLS